MKLSGARSVVDSFELNDEQRQAVFAPDGPHLVLAGAGSGKTRALVARVAYLIESGKRPSSIMALTFTNKAADEMKMRLAQLLGPEAHEVTAGTFHSVAHRLLRAYGGDLGLRDYRILDDDESYGIIKRIVDDYTWRSASSHDVKRVTRFIDMQKNQGRHVRDLEWVRGKNEELVDIYREYQAYLHDRGYMDFGDLILSFIDLCNRPEIRERIHRRFHHILVDEYQDINRAQYLMLNCLVGEDRNLWVVGDSDQSIYGWRGAEIDHILNFHRDFPEARTVILKENYRSTVIIVEATNALIRNNRKRIPKDLASAGDLGNPIEVVYPSNPTQEAAWVARRVRGLIDSGIPPGEIAVLYRTHRQATLIDEAMARRNIPYDVVGQVGFYDRQEIKDALSYIRLAARLDDGEALIRILNVPKRGLGKTAQTRIEQLVVTGRPSLEALDVLKSELRSRPAKEGVATLRWILEQNSALSQMSAAEAVPQIIERSGLLEYYEQDEDGDRRLGNIRRLIEIAEAFGPWISLAEFVNEIRLRSDESDDGARNTVSLMTIHAAKGTEFDTVFIVGANQGIFPLGGQENLEEERRLFYVAATRAKRNLIITSPKAIIVKGQVKPASPSVFLRELPGHLTNVTPRIEEASGL